MKVKRKIIEIDQELCDGCGFCVPACAEGAIELRDGKAHLVAEKFCDGLGACLGECPKGALRIVEREAEDFDERAVEEYLRQKEAATPAPEPVLACGCPSAQVQTLAPAAPMPAPGLLASALSNWPIKLKLIPAKAPFLRQAELLILADCSALAYPRVHQELLPGKVVLLACPTFEDFQENLEKLTAIFRQNDLKSITTVIMEVPCCAGLAYLVEKALAAAGKQVPHEQVVVSTRGEILSRERLAA